VVGMYVAQEQTGRGIGGSLMRALIDEPRAIKVDGRAYAKTHMYLELSPS
jgi:L-amino acid N-acyltransferase YncA